MTPPIPRTVRPVPPPGRARLRFARPLVGMECLKTLLGLNEHEARAEIAAGRLKWAFDVRAGGDRQFLRVLSLSVLAWLMPEVKQPGDLGGAIDLIVPPADPETGAVASTSLGACLNVSPDHLRRLARVKRLLLVGGRPARRGVPMPVTRGSAVRFLRRAHGRVLDELSFNTGALRADRPRPGRTTHPEADTHYFSE